MPRLSSVKRSVMLQRVEWLRTVWRVAVAGVVDPRRLVFVDEVVTNTLLSPLYAYSLKGRKAYTQIPRNRRANTTLLASMNLEVKGP